MSKLKVIKASRLIEIRASIRRNYKSKWGFDVWNDEKVLKMGENESLGGESFDDTIRTAETLNLLDSLIAECKIL